MLEANQQKLQKHSYHSEKFTQYSFTNGIYYSFVDEEGKAVRTVMKSTRENYLQMISERREKWAIDLIKLICCKETSDAHQLPFD